MPTDGTPAAVVSATTLALRDHAGSGVSTRIWLRDTAQHLRGGRQRLADRNPFWERSPEDTHRRCPQGEREIHHELAFPHALGAASVVNLCELAGGVQRWHTQPTGSGGLNHAP